MASETAYKIGVCDCNEMDNCFYLSLPRLDLPNEFPGVYYVNRVGLNEVLLMLEYSYDGPYYEDDILPRKLSTVENENYTISTNLPLSPPRQPTLILGATNGLTSSENQNNTIFKRSTFVQKHKRTAPQPPPPKPTKHVTFGVSPGKNNFNCEGPKKHPDLPPKPVSFDSPPSSQPGKDATLAPQATVSTADTNNATNAVKVNPEKPPLPLKPSILWNSRNRSFTSPSPPLNLTMQTPQITSELETLDTDKTTPPPPPPLPTQDTVSVVQPTVISPVNPGLLSEISQFDRNNLKKVAHKENQSARLPELVQELQKRASVMLNLDDSGDEETSSEWSA